MMREAAISLLLSPVILMSGCGAVPGSCGSAWVKVPSFESYRYRLDQLKDLQRKCKLKNAILAAQTQSIFPTQDAYKKVVQLGYTYTSVSDMAQRAEAMEKALSPRDRRRLVGLWNDYLLAQIKASETLWSETLCSNKEYAQSLGEDFTFMASIPLILKDWKSMNDESGAMVVVGPALTLWGTMGLVGDVVTYVPSTLARQLGPIKKNRRIKKAARAYIRFVDEVARLEESQRKAK